MDFKIKRIDHLGIIAGVMKDLDIVALTDSRLKNDKQADVTFGETLMAMILNGLGFANRVISLTPQFFSNKPLSLLIRPGIKKDQLNRHKIGRTLDRIASYGCETFFNEIALKICVAEKIDLRTRHNDTTTFSFEGAYDDQDEEAEIFITHGYSKAKRPDLKQIILEMCVSKDGGVPIIMKPWSGNTADNKIFKEHVKAMHKAACESNVGRILIADSKLYTKENINELGLSHFITRVPSTIKLGVEHVNIALKKDSWTKCPTSKNNKEQNLKDWDKKGYKFQSFDLKHYNTKMRWIVFHSQQAHNRAKKTLDKMVKKQEILLKKDLFHLKAQRYSCHDDARKAVDQTVKKYKYFFVEDVKINKVETYQTAGRPKKTSLKQKAFYQICTKINVNQDVFAHNLDHRSCFILATNIPKQDLTAANVLNEYKGQDCVEKGFAFMKAPSFFAEAFYIKSVKRIQALLVVMTLALLIYTVAQRRLRQWLAINKKTIPNQINKQIARPTLRWAFQLLEGIDYFINFAIAGPTQKIVTGITDLRRLILSAFGKTVMKIYDINPI